jgi:putative tryptophan/tyrosine transport system substrate-binding protein
VLVDKKAGALVVSGDAFFTDARDQIVALAARYRVPAIYHAREYAMAGGFVSYGSSLPDAFRQAGFYAGESSRAKGHPTCQSNSPPKWN